MGGDGDTTTRRVLIARHPETVANREGRYIAEADSPYTPRGARQAASLARCIGAFRPDAVLASPARRALEPASSGAAAAGARLLVEERLREVGWGDAEGLTYAEVRRAGVPMDYLGGPDAGEIAGGGESWASFTRRIREAAGLIAEAGERVAVVTHGGVVRALLVTWLGLPAEAAWRFAIRPASVTVVKLADGHGALEVFGMTPGTCVRTPGRD
ncbi:MAG: histidine phosphatase family protein [Coriobacteriia bacterium]|nr:histidine phosphatase family protein [Coriobacteriia bacterium]